VLEARFSPLASPTKVPSAGHGLQRYRELLPGGDDPDWVSLGAGGTPLVRSRHIGPRLGLGRLWFKLEASNPSGSFKDRYVAVTANLARQFGFSRVVVSSTGNLGISTAAYAAALDLECLLIAVPEIPAPMLGQALAHGAHVALTSRAERERVFEHCAADPGRFPIGLFLARPVQNPFGIEGYRTLAWEMIDTLGAAPTAVLFPCARGNGLYGSWKGFLEAKRWGWTDGLPSLFACQPQGANSLEVSLEAGSERVIELPPVDSIAASASESVADDRALHAIRESSGGAASVDDAALLEATAAVGREGIWVEPTSALPIACLAQLVERGTVGGNEDVVCVLTATGTRWPDRLPRFGEVLPRVSLDDGSVERLLEQTFR
jgi:threonine synthase